MLVKHIPLKIVLLCLCMVVKCNAENTAPASLDQVSEKSIEQVPGGKQPREFQGDNISQVLRLLARQAKIDLVISEGVSGTVTLRSQNMTALQTIDVIVRDKKLIKKELDGTFFIEPGPDYIPITQSPSLPSEISLFGGNAAKMELLSFGYGLLGLLIGYGTIIVFVLGFIHLVSSICTAFTGVGKAINPSFFKRLGLLLLLGPFALTIAVRNPTQIISE